MAGLAGLSESYIADYENGYGSKLNVVTLDKISKALGVTMNDLLEDSLDCYDISDNYKKLKDIIDSFDNEQTEVYLQLVKDYLNSKS